MAPPPPQVEVQNPEQKTVTVYKSFPGRLVAHDEVEIRARVKGFLKTIEFKDGQVAREGDLLFTLEPEQYEAAVKSAQARLAQAQAALKLADATLKRNQDAFKTKAVSEVDVLTAEANQQAAAATVLEARAALDNAKLDLSYTKIHAPMTGRMARRALSEGNLVGDGQSTLLSKLVVESPVDVLFNINERDALSFLRSGRRGEVPKASELPPVKLELADGATHDEEGKADYIDPEFDPGTGTAQARAVFANADKKLVPGLYAKVLIPRALENALLVPDLAVQQDMGGAYVLTVDSSNVVESVYIAKGPLVGTERVVEQAPAATRHLAADDRVIVHGLQRARPGIVVTPVPAQKPAQK